MGKFIANALLELGRHKMKLRGGATVLFESKTPRKLSPVFIMSEDGEYEIPSPEGELMLESGKVAVIDANGLLTGVFTSKDAERYMAILKSGKAPKRHMITKEQLTELRTQLKL